MTATVDEVMKLADVERCLKETGVASTYNHCHNACVWLVKEIKKSGISDFNIHLCVGTFWGKDHSWLVVEDPESGEYHVVDMTVNQFVDRKVPYTAVMGDEYDMRDAVMLCSDTTDLIEFIDKMGG